MAWLLPYGMQAQARIGSTEWQIRSDFSDKTFTSGTTNDGVDWIAWETETVFAIYYFNDAGRCYRTCISPYTEGALHFLIETYNKKYVIVSDTHWKYYSENGIMNIYLIFEDGYRYFMME